jgi:putative endonuclease
MPWTYILQCRDGTYYVGSTFDIERRVSEHNLGFGAAYTRPRRRRPVRVVWSAEFDRMDQAYWYEKQIQGWGREKRQALIEGRWDDLPTLARNRETSDESAVCVAGQGICECERCGASRQAR